MANKMLNVDSEQFADLRQVLAKLDPGGRRAWLLEVYNLRDGENVLSGVLDIKTGRPWRKPAQPAQGGLRQET